MWQQVQHRQAVFQTLLLRHINPYPLKIGPESVHAFIQVWACLSQDKKSTPEVFMQMGKVSFGRC